MRKLVVALVVVLVAGFAVELSAQEGRGRGSTYRGVRGSLKREADKAEKQSEQNRKEAARKAEKAREEEEREAEKEEREAAKKEKKGEDAAGDAMEMPEGPEAEEAKPGDTIPRAEKDEILDEIMDELGLKDAALREKFKKSVRGAWEDSEKEDKRYYGEYKKSDNDDKKAAAKKTHQEKLKGVWDKSDTELDKDKVLNEEQKKKWKDASKDLREKTATDWWEEAQREKAAREAAEKEAAEGKKDEAKPEGDGK